MTKYAKNTSVPVNRSKNEIEAIVKRYGATDFVYGDFNEKILIAFRLRGQLIRFSINLPSVSDFQQTKTGLLRKGNAAIVERDKAIRQKWRALALIIKAKLEAIESDVQFENEFMPYIVLPGGKTVAEEIGPRLQQLPSDGKDIFLLPDYSH